MAEKQDYRPVVIIGAARSGTNMLRDCLTRFAGIGTWPCDEINLIWRHGNRDFPTDEFAPEQANDTAARYIRAAFARLARRDHLSIIVEKTCANSLRVPFVDAILPTAKYIYLVRDGRDATASAMKRWVAPIDLPYLVRKARFTPLSDIPAYGLRFLSNRIHQWRSPERRQAYWGPRIGAVETLVADRPLAEICAWQWAKTVQASETTFAAINPDRMIRLRYEDFVAAPEDEMLRILAFIGFRADGEDVTRSVADVRRETTGDWRRSVPEDQQQTVMDICRPMLEQLGYVDTR